MVAIGQMFVITLGPGNIDLSIPTTMVRPSPSPSGTTTSGF